ncbi:MAG: cation-translocating P-type ATPase [Bacteroidota bacterium]
MNIDQGLPYYELTAGEAIERLQSDSNGLSEEEARNRLKRFGENKLPEKGKANIFKLIFKQFKDFLVLILAIAAVISYLTGHMVDVYVIIGVIVVNATIGFVQEYRAEKSIESLKKLVKHKATVLRQGERFIVEARELVPGDIVLLDEGLSIPADARLIRKKNLQVVEASLTGESLPVDKDPEPLEEGTSVADRTNMVFKGTHVARGSGKAIITATGENTELGKIAESLKEVEDKESSFRKKTARLAKIMAGIAVSTALIVFLTGYFIRDFDFDDILLVTIATLVSSIPEGLPAVLSIVLAIGANRMARQNAIIREFTATETAGSLNVIISDKTGTITKGILTIKKLFLADGKEYDVTGDGYETKGDIMSGDSVVDIKDNRFLAKSLIIAEKCNDASLKEKDEDDNERDILGDPTEVALLVLAKKTGIISLPEFSDIELIDDLPFNSEQKFRASLISYPDKHREKIFVGAPEKILSVSDRILSPEGHEKLSEEKKQEISGKIKDLSSRSMRVVAHAFKDGGEQDDEINPDDAHELVFVGLYGIIDPPRPEVKLAVEECKSAGIRVIMATGDHADTAEAIARETGILENGSGSEDCPAVFDEQMLDVDDETLDRYTRCGSVFARVNPQNKLRIAKSLQGKNILIGMTGDGVNDAPALKVADVGIAMGQKGTDVARDASQIVLSDDNFASIVNAIKEGRIVFRNVRQTSFFLITTNFASTLTLIAAIAIGFTYPLLPTQILWINLVTDGVMDVSLATEPGHGDSMDHKPLKKDEPILNKQIIPYLLIIVPVMVSLALLVFNHYQGESVEKARTGVFLVVGMTQVFNAFNMRSLRQSAFSIGFFRNKWIILAFFASLALQFAAIKLPFLKEIFHFRDLAWPDILIITALSSLVFGFGELYKAIRKKLRKIREVR